MTDATAFPCEALGWGQFQRLARRLARQVQASGFCPDLIVAIARGGYPPARILSDYLDQPELSAVRIVHYRGAHKTRTARIVDPLTAPVRGRRVLLVDDVSDSGDTFAVALQHLRQCGPPADLRTAVLDHKTRSAYVPDFHARVITRWRWIIYPWARMEDLRSLIADLPQPAHDARQVARALHARHGLRLPLATVADALRRPNC